MQENPHTHMHTHTHPHTHAHTLTHTHTHAGTHTYTPLHTHADTHIHTHTHTHTHPHTHAHTHAHKHTHAYTHKTRCSGFCWRRDPLRNHKPIRTGAHAEARTSTGGWNLSLPSACSDRAASLLDMLGAPEVLMRRTGRVKKV
jgi:hypothetical protein